MIRKIGSVLLVLAALGGASAMAQGVEVSDAYARATVTGQKASSAFMKLRASATTRLVAASTPVAGTVQVHEMHMDGDVMKMREIAALDLPAGQVVELTPGGLHIMLLDLKSALRPDQSIALTLVFKDAQGRASRQVIQVPVKSMTGGSGMGEMHHDHGAMH